MRASFQKQYEVTTNTANPVNIGLIQNRFNDISGKWEYLFTPRDGVMLGADCLIDIANRLKDLNNSL